ncbi:hypothetical protein L798_00707 [Zootermopsis nevadensis]|uniref:Uncharacterized protein n=1 Tax=Zootermopsis nevadensis TaxID=136037 RepID=A0A067QXA4_ZOONE|nr:hypothetical protein L798_00707 [Zootermopsis nevadensis]
MKRHRHTVSASSAREILKVCSEHYTHSTFVTRTMSKRYSSSSHVRCSISTSTVSRAAAILSFRFSMSATGVQYRVFFVSHRKESQSVISGDLAGQEKGPTRPIHRFVKR